MVARKGSVKKLGILDRITDLIKEVGLQYEIFDQVTKEPKSDDVNLGAQFARETNCSFVIGVGGGSAMDASKAIAISLSTGEKIEKFINGPYIYESKFPVITIPTVAGTSAELSKGAIIIDLEKEIKGGVRGEGVFPVASIIDPELTLTVPPRVTAVTGFDIFAHAVETYLSIKANWLTEMFSVRAIKEVVRFLPRAYQNGKDLEARTRISFASFLMGFNLSNSSNCLPHRMQYPLGAVSGSGHEEGLIALYPAWLKMVEKKVPAKVSRILQVMFPGKSEKKNIDLIPGFFKRMGLEIRLRDLGLQYEDCEKLASMIVGDLNVDPLEPSQEDIIRIYRESW